MLLEWEKEHSIMIPGNIHTALHGFVNSACVHLVRWNILSKAWIVPDFEWHQESNCMTATAYPSLSFIKQSGPQLQHMDHIISHKFSVQFMSGNIYGMIDKFAA